MAKRSAWLTYKRASTHVVQPESSKAKPASAGLFASVLHNASALLSGIWPYRGTRRRADRADTRKMTAVFARGALRLPAVAPLGLAARPQGAAAARIARRGASIGLVAARPPLASQRRAASLGLLVARPPLASQRCARAFAAASDDDDQNRSLDALGDDFFERSRLEDRGNQRATPAGDLQYAGERPGNWEELLAEAEASYPERAGPRRSKHLRREARRFKNIRRQHYQRKRERMAAHTRNMARRSRLAAARRGWDGPRLRNP